MTHMGPMSESEGTFRAPEPPRQCPKCKQMTLICRTWESSDGAYEDDKYECQNPQCHYVRWIEGPDA